MFLRKAVARMHGAPRVATSQQRHFGIGDTIMGMATRKVEESKGARSTTFCSPSSSSLLPDH
jgi:hypothetical protein